MRNLLRNFLILFFIVLLAIITPVRATAAENVGGILEAHNAVREKLGIDKLVWSDKIADYAQEWTDYLAEENQCSLQHRFQAGMENKPYGENILWASGTKWSNGNIEVQQVKATDVVSRWAQEAINYDYASNTCSQGKYCGHYTQVVWKKSEKLGCGMTVCADKSQIWVCNYMPPGNISGKKPY